jgi:hypothetical protein
MPLQKQTSQKPKNNIIMRKVFVNYLTGEYYDINFRNSASGAS